MILLNCSFNLNMIENLENVKTVKTISSIIEEETFKNLLEKENPENYIGHADLVNVLNSSLGVNLKAERKTLKVKGNEERIIIVQYIGERLPEGATKLPEKAKIKFVFEEVFIERF